MSKKRIMITIEHADYERLRLMAFEGRTTVAALAREFVAERVHTAEGSRS